ncbi:Plug domain-containing protein, partial [Rhodopseudomonas sp. WA056]|uniref:Plug domain-containing protein n=1 Tax=Rhodopseudomonas sp. WA056 TaxID=2269367 RepID=UPI0013DF5538
MKADAHPELRGLTEGVETGARRRSVSTIAVAALLTSSSQLCFAQSATPGATITLDTIVVEQRREVVRSPARPQSVVRRAAPAATPSTAPAASATRTVDLVRERFNVLAGGVALVSQKDMPNAGNPTLANTLSGVPGLIIQNFLGANDQPRIQMRGSAQQNPAERGVLVLYNGLPINRADGSYI